ncbi:hypothetical protein GQ44DRAFT_623987 [Phaeosphaeriaceae sp. PMI808]|nr:hypothetical protein GQ44DRAFT_623987 [Phaeosphaeriaceae sp. PMI808]
MRFSGISILALSSFSLANPVLSKRADAVSLLNDLYTAVQIYTGAINATLTPLSVSSFIIEKTAATAQVGTQISLTAAAVTSTTDDIKALPPSDTENEAKTNEFQPKEKHQLIAVGAILSLIIVEIFATVTAAVAILGLAGLLVFLNPLTSALSFLIMAIQLVLNIVLVEIIVLLNSLLSTLALGVSGL